MKENVLKLITVCCFLLLGLGNASAQLDCDCDFEIDPVCVATVEGDTIPFPNACLAECAGFGEDTVVECPDYGEWPGEDCDCEFTGEPVCVATVDGDTIPFPNACFAACEGFGEDAIVECDDEVEPPFEDCDCDFEFDPVCVVTVEGDTIPFPSACFAACEGFGEDAIVECPDYGEWPGDDCDCELDGETVCVLTEDDLICVFPNLCYAECAGYTIDDVVECDDEVEPPFEDCDCEFDIDPVCVEADGEILTFPNACLAECFGYSVDTFVDCEIEDPGTGCDCDFEFDPVCVVTVEGDTIPFPSACFAACEGFGEDAIVECPDYGEWPGDDCDCELDGETVCVLTEDDLICVFPNLCYAECAGYTIDDVVECDDEVEPPFEDCDCEFDIDPVCVEADGEILTFPNACLAECFGYSVDTFVDCEIEDPGTGCDCDFEFDPVCVVTVEGDTIPFPSACFAACEGFGEDAIVECPDYGEWPGDDCDCELDGETVCVLTEDDLICVFPNLCYAECAGYTIDDVVECDDEVEPPFEDCDCEFDIDPVCVEADGEILTFPNACLAECFGYSVDTFVDCEIEDPGTGCDCDFEFDPVCVVTVEGDTIPFPSACLAACEGFGEDAIVECPDYGEWPGDDCDCELDGETVCVLTEDDLICVFPNLCYAECAGYTIDDVVECDDEEIPPFEDCDCEFDIDPVCVDIDGVILTLPNACFAACLGFDEDSFVDCGDLDTEGLLEHTKAIDQIFNLEDLFSWYSTGETSTVSSAEIKSVNLSPNPVGNNAELTIELELEAASDVQISVLSLNGRVIEIIQGNMEQGRQQIKFNSSQLTSGVYFTKIETANSVEVLKFVKQ